MPSFKYVARDAKTGLEAAGRLEADTEEAGIDLLFKRNQLVVSIQPDVTRKGRTSGGSVRLKDLVLFTRQFATMVDAGLVIVGCLDGLAHQVKSPMLRSVLRDVCARIERGDTLADAMAKHPKVFDKLYVCLVAAGEESGLLPEALSRIATDLENALRLRRKVKSAMMYPTVVSVVAIALTIFLLAKVVPVFGETFESFKGKLPAPTQFLIQVSNFVKTWLVLILLLLGGGVYGWLSFLKTRLGRELWDAWRIKLPVFGGIAHGICLARFARTFSSLVRSAVPILSVLEISAKACGNVAMGKAAMTAMEDIKRGEGIANSLAKHPVFPDMIIRMLSAGEQTGRLDNMMERIADHLEEEAETSLSGLTSLIEPILVVVLGVVVGGIVICMFLPIFKLSSIINGIR